MRSSIFRIVQFFQDNKFITTIVLISVLVIGFYLGGLLPKEVAPQVEADAIHINIYAPTSSAQEIEQDIIIPFEEVIQSFDVSLSYTSFANDSYGRVRVAIPINRQTSSVRQRLMSVLQNITDLPSSAKIMITEEGPQSIPVYYFTLQLKPSVEESKTNKQILQQTGQLINKKLSRISEIYTVETGGLLQEEIYVDINPNRLKNFYISLQEIIQTLLRRNITASEGLIEIGSEEQILVTDAGFRTPLDITNTIIRSNFDRKGVKISDVATITQGYEQQNNDVYINDKSAIFFGIRAKYNTDLEKLTESVDTLLESVSQTLPEELELTIVERRSEAVNELISLSQMSALQGIFIVFLVLLIFLDWKTAFWTTMSIPVSLAMLLISMHFLNISMNLITLCGVVTVLGMLVDHGIIISENIYHYKELGYSSSESVRLGLKGVMVPILVTVITTIAAFMPLLLIQGTIGNLIHPFAIVVCCALIFSFIDAVLFLPVHLTDIPTKETTKNTTPWFKNINYVYGIILKKTLRWRYIIVLIFVSLLIWTITLTRSMMKNFVFLEPVGVQSLYINLESPTGTSRDEMRSLVAKVKSHIQALLPTNEVSVIKEDVGKYHVLELFSKGFAPNRGQVSVYLSPLSKRKRGHDEILKSIQESISNTSLQTNFTKVNYEFFGLIPKSAATLNIRFLQGIGSQSDNYIKAMTEVYAFITNLSEIKNAQHSPLIGKDRIVLNFDYSKMASMGIDPRIVSDSLKIAVSGFIPTMWRSSSGTVPYIVRFDPKYKQSLDKLYTLQVPNYFNKLISISQFTTISTRQGSPDISRSLGQKMVEIGVEIDEDKTTPTVINAQVNEFYKTIQSKYPDVDLEFSGESVIISNAFEDFKFAFAVAGLLIYIILLLLFKEPLQPFIVLVSIPFGIIGAIWAFYFHGQTLSFMSFVGIVGLSGIVVNDAVVMVDFINSVFKKRNPQHQPIDLIVEGAQHRLKAVVLTTVTTVSGLLPSIYGMKGVADALVPIATAIAYGLLFATLLTLIFIPALYMIVHDMVHIFKKNRNSPIEQVIHE